MSHYQKITWSSFTFTATSEPKQQQPEKPDQEDSEPMDTDDKTGYHDIQYSTSKTNNHKYIVFTIIHSH